jgi:lipopolysaccharide transport system permease protein
MSVYTIFRPQRNLGAIREVLRVAWLRRELLYGMTRRDLFEKYAAQSLSAVWVFAQPLVVVAVYVAFFNFVVGRSMVRETTGASYAQYVVAGLLPWILASSVLSRAPSALISQRAILRQLAFPVELLTLVPAIATGFVMAIVSIVMVAWFALAGGIGPAIALLPVAFLLLLVFLVGLTMFVSVMNVFVRDLQEVTTLFLSIGVYLTPIAFNFSAAPAAYKAVMLANPFTYFILCFQHCLYHGTAGQWYAWPVAIALAFVSMGVGARFFLIMKPHAISYL